MSDAALARGAWGRASRALARSAGAGLALILLAPQGLTAEGKEPTRLRLRARPIASTRGVDLYNEYCAQCHGTAGRGDGRLAKGLRVPPADLTRIAERNGGSFSRVGVARYVMGDRAGGSTHLDEDWNPVVIRGGKADDMPLWNYLFQTIYPGEPNRLRFENLAKHLESIQVQ